MNLDINSCNLQSKLTDWLSKKSNMFGSVGANLRELNTGIIKAKQSLEGLVSAPNFISFGAELLGLNLKDQESVAAFKKRWSGVVDDIEGVFANIENFDICSLGNIKAKQNEDGTLSKVTTPQLAKIPDDSPSAEEGLSNVASDPSSWSAYANDRGKMIDSTPKKAIDSKVEFNSIIDNIYEIAFEKYPDPSVEELDSILLDPDWTAYKSSGNITSNLQSKLSEYSIKYSNHFVAQLVLHNIALNTKNAILKANLAQKQTFTVEELFGDYGSNVLVDVGRTIGPENFGVKQTKENFDAQKNIIEFVYGIAKQQLVDSEKYTVLFDEVVNDEIPE